MKKSFILLLTVLFSVSLFANNIIKDNFYYSIDTITNTATGLQFSSSVGNNTKITTKAAGTYVFAFGMNDSKLSVTYSG